MLVLSRKAAETIVIGNRIQVTILQAKRGSVRIGIEAPRDVPVVRGELCPLGEAAEPEMEELARCLPAAKRPT